MLEYYARFRRTLWKDFKKSTGEQVIGAFVAIAILLLQIHYGVIKPGEIPPNARSVAWPYIALVGVLFLYHLVRVPPKLDEEREKKISELQVFKAAVEEQEVRLEIVKCCTEVVRHHFADQSTELGLALRAIFANHRKEGVPGKIAKQVAAVLTYTDVNKHQLRIEGRWAQSDQPESIDKLKSILHLLRIDFGVGSELELDIAAKFPSDQNQICYAIDNRSFPHIREDRTALMGPRIIAQVELIAEYVHQRFEVEIDSSLGKLECKSCREI